MSSDPSYPQDRPAGPPPTQPVPQAPPYARPPEQAYPQPQQYSQPYAPGQDGQHVTFQPAAPDGRIAFAPPGPTVEHPQATLAFVLGLLAILGLLILGPFGWYYGRKVIREIDQDPRPYGNRGLAMAGMVLGIVATAFMALLVVLLGFGIVLAIASR